MEKEREELLVSEFLIATLFMRPQFRKGEREQKREKENGRKKKKKTLPINGERKKEVN